MTIDELDRFEQSLKAKETRLRSAHRTAAAQQIAIILYQLKRIRPVIAEFEAPLELAPSVMLPDPPTEPPRRKGKGTAA